MLRDLVPACCLASCGEPAHHEGLQALTIGFGNNFATKIISSLQDTESMRAEPNRHIDPSLLSIAHVDHQIMEKKHIQIIQHSNSGRHTNKIKQVSRHSRSATQHHGTLMKSCGNHALPATVQDIPAIGIPNMHGVTDERSLRTGFALGCEANSEHTAECCPLARPWDHRSSMNLSQRINACGVVVAPSGDGISKMSNAYNHCTNF